MPEFEGAIEWVAVSGVAAAGVWLRLIDGGVATLISAFASLGLNSLND